MSTGGMAAVGLVARREVVARLRQRGFLVSAAVTILVILAVVLVPSFLDGGKSYDVAVAGAQRGALSSALVDAGHAQDVDISTATYADAAQARRAVSDGDANAAVIDGTLVTRGGADTALSTVVNAAYRSVATAERLRAAGLDPGRVSAALNVPPLRERTLDAGADERRTRRGIAFIGVVVLFAQLVGYSTWVAFGVVEEKSSRVVELLLATLRPWQLLAGKVLGTGVLALGQLVVVSGVGLGAALATDSVHLPPGSVGVVAQVFAWFVLGYAFISSAYAAVASLVSRQEDLGNVTGPMTMVLMAGYFVAVYTTQKPDSAIAGVASFVPPFSAMTMPARTAGGDVALWQVAVSVLVMLVATAAMVRLSGRIYANAVLHTGARVRVFEALRRGARHPEATTTAV